MKKALILIVCLMGMALTSKAQNSTAFHVVVPDGHSISITLRTKNDQQEKTHQKQHRYSDCVESQ